MKSIKAAIAAIATLATTIAFGGGLYIVSGGDFRISRIKYVVETTNDNQTVELTPYSVRLLSVNNNIGARNHTGPWSIKFLGHEEVFGEFDNIRQTLNTEGYVGNYGGTNINPVTYTFPKAGRYLVKLYDMKDNIYNLQIQNPDIVSLYVDWTDISSLDSFLPNLSMAISTFSPKTKYVHWGLPIGKTGLTFPDGMQPAKSTWYGATSMEIIEIPNPYPFVAIRDNACENYTNLTSDAIFPNVTNMMRNAYKMAKQVQYASFPNVQIVGEYVFNLGGLPAAQFGNSGLKTLRIGDTLTSIGLNSFYAQDNLTTIEFVTDEADWVAAWNNHAIFPNWLGQASAVEGKDDEATLTPIPGATAKDGPYYSGVRNPKPTKVIRIRRSN